jgi:hypothetical protein
LKKLHEEANVLRQYLRAAIVISALVCVFGVSNLPAQYAKSPDAYSISYTESMMMPNQQVKILRDGNHVVTEELTPKSGPMPRSTHTIASIDLETHKELSADLQDASVPCGVGTLGGGLGDWSGNPFEWFSQFFDGDISTVNPPKVGSDTVAGMKATIYEISAPGGRRAKVWIDDKYGLMLKMTAPGQDGGMETVLEVKSFTVGKPPASAFKMPARCAGAK